MRAQAPAGFSDRKKARYLAAVGQGAPHEAAMRVASGRMRTIALDLRFARDEIAQSLVEQHPSGCDRARIAEAYSVSVELIRQTEVEALRKLRGRINPRDYAYLAEVSGGDR